MRKMAAWSLILVGLLSGCEVAAGLGLAPGSGASVNRRAPKVQAASKTSEPSTTETAKGQDADADTDSSKQASQAAVAEERPASAASGTTSQDSAATDGSPTSLSLDGAPQGNVRLIPQWGDDGSLVKILFSGDASTVKWKVQASKGPSALAVAKVKLALELEASYPPTVPDIELPAELLASLAEDPEAPETVPDSEATPPSQVVKEFAPAELSWPTSFAAGQAVELTYDFESVLVESFVEDRPLVSRIGVSITLLDAQGAALVDKLGKPVVLTHSVQVL